MISRKNLKKNTFSIKKGDHISLEFIEEMLHEYKFNRTDFVYEPGQYSIRGSIADVFSYSADMPFRIDFFGEEVDSIRSFNTDDQLSIEIFNEISIIPNIQDLYIEEIKDTFFDFIPPSSMLWIEEATFIKDKVNNIYNQTSTREDAGQISDKKEIVITGSRLLEECEKFRIAEFGRNNFFLPDEKFLFNTEPQPNFNKNFEILGEKLLSNQLSDYTNYIVSENQSQIDRLQDIFKEINSKIRFVPLIVNIHQGYTDNDLKISIYTDHQIFDRYHKFRIKGYFTKKDSISIKELTGLNPVIMWYTLIME